MEVSIPKPQEDEVIQRAIDAFNSKASGTQLRPDANMLMQLRKFKDTKKNGEVRADDMKSVKVKHQDAVKVHDILMSVKVSFVINTLDYYKKIVNHLKRLSMTY